VVPFVLQIFGAVGLVGYLSYRNGQQAVNDLANRLMDKSNELVSERLRSYLETPQKINQVNLDAIELNLLNLNDFQKTGHYFWKQLQIYPNVSYIAYALKTGEFSGAGRVFPEHGITIEEVSPRTKWINEVYATDRHGNRQKVVKIYNDYKPLTEDWYKETVKAKKTVWGEIYNWDDSPEFISATINSPIYNSSKQLVGVIGIDLLLSSISDFLKELKVSPAAKIFIIERDGFLVGSSSTEKTI
jgi:hypothetical protein